MRLFVDKFKELGERETRSATIPKGNDHYALPPDEYAFVEHYCDEKNCDCRRVMISVYAHKANRILATISMGFDSGEDDSAPFLDPLNTQSEYSEGLLGLFVDVLNADPAYLARLQRHYVMFKEKTDRRKYSGRPFENPGRIERNEHFPFFRSVSPLKPAEVKPAGPDRPKVGRNEPCPCGSGKKYKRCCLISSGEGETDPISAPPPRSSRKRGVRGTRAPGASEEPTAGGIEEAEALVRSVVRHMKQTTDQKMIDEHTDALLKENPLIVDSLLRLLIERYAPDGVEREMSKSYQACLALIEFALTEIRYSIERNRAWAVDAAERIQREMAARAFEVEVDVRVQADLVRALYDAGLKIHPDIKSKTEKLAEYYGRFTARKGRPDMDRLLGELASSGPDDPFELMERLMAELDLIPVSGQAYAAVEMARASNPLIREVAALMLLHPNREVRIHVPSMFLELASPGSFSPVALRRMIGLRNWLPEAERHALDGLIRKVREAHVECAPMPPPQQAKTYGSPFDGSGAQGFWTIVGKNRNHRMISVLVKQGIGIRDVMRLDDMDRREVEGFIQEMGGKAMSEQIEPSYMHRAVSHFIWVGLQSSQPPPAGMLRVAEELGCDYWIPRRMVLEDEISSLEGLIDPRLLSDTNVSRVLDESIYWPKQERFAASWFEDDSMVDDLVASVPGLSRPSGTGAMEEAVVLIIEKIIRPKFDVWAERLLWMTLWAKACKKRSPVPWEDFFIVAREFRRSTPPTEIPLLLAVAGRSIISALSRMRA